MSKKRFILIIIFWLVVVSAAGFAISSFAVGVNNWSAKNGIQKPIVLLIGKTANVSEDTVFSIKSRELVFKRKPIVILSPYVKELEKPVDVNSLSEIDQKIYDTFGPLNFKEARAVATCESGKQRVNTNWGSRDVGFWQINVPIWRQKVIEKFGWDYDEWYDLDKNFQIAYWIWDRGDGIEGNGQGNFNAWVARRTECFLGALQ